MTSMVSRNLCALAQRTMLDLLRTRASGIIVSQKLTVSSTAPRFGFTFRQLSTQLQIQAVPAVARLIHPEVSVSEPKSDPSVILSNAEDTLTIQEAGNKLEVPLLWLRDSCPCQDCVDQQTNQRKNWTIRTDTKLKEAEITNGNLCAVWTDGHESTHSLDLVRKSFQLVKEPPLVRRHKWHRQTWRGLPLPVIPHDEVSTDAGLHRLLGNIHRFGFGLVNDCGVSEADTEKLVRRIGSPMPTTFSPGMWTFTSNMARSDTAYSNDYLAPHTDATYFSNPCRIQVFHCLERDGCTGGETILVDGLQCADRLQQESPAALATLSTVAQECVYVEPGVSYKWTDTVFTSSKVDKSLQRVRFNVYDRSAAPPVCAAQDANQYYVALKKYADLTQARENQLLLTLTPGVVVFIDNWRVLHGRTAFDGKRVLTGCYMDNDEFNHACRKSNVIV